MHVCGCQPSSMHAGHASGSRLLLFLQNGPGVCAMHDPPEREAAGPGPLLQHMPCWSLLTSLCTQHSLLCFCSVYVFLPTFVDTATQIVTISQDANQNLELRNQSLYRQQQEHFLNVSIVQLTHLDCIRMLLCLQACMLIVLYMHM